MLTTTDSILFPSGRDTKLGHPKREVSKACLHLLIALFRATTQICLIHVLAVSGQPRSCFTLAGPVGRELGYFLFFYALYFGKKGTQGIRENSQSMSHPAAYCVDT